MGISADIDVKDEEDDKIVLEIQTKDPELVIGRQGEVMDALQHLVSKVVYRERTGEKGKPLVVDAGGYRDKHVERLQAARPRGWPRRRWRRKRSSSCSRCRRTIAASCTWRSPRSPG